MSKNFVYAVEGIYKGIIPLFVRPGFAMRARFDDRNRRRRRYSTVC